MREGKSRVARPRDFFRLFGNEIFVEIPAAQKPVDGTVVVPAQTLVRSSLIAGTEYFYSYAKTALMSNLQPVLTKRILSQRTPFLFRYKSKI